MVALETTALVQSVQRALQLLKAFDGAHTELGVTELSRATGLPKSTVSRLITTLEYEGMIEHAPGSEKYRLGFQLVRLAQHVSHFGDLRGVARPVVERLVERAAETVHLAVLDGVEVVNIDQLVGPHMVRTDNWIGRRTPLHCVANGKALLAFQPEALITAVLAGPLSRRTDRTLSDPELLQVDLSLIRSRGYATAIGEFEPGLNGVAAPIRDEHGLVFASLSLSGPAYRVPVSRLAELGLMAVAAADEISLRLGYRA